MTERDRPRTIGGVHSLRFPELSNLLHFKPSFSTISFAKWKILSLSDLLTKETVLLKSSAKEEPRLCNLEGLEQLVVGCFLIALAMHVVKKFLKVTGVFYL